jgi:hypothetical protein
MGEVTPPSKADGVFSLLDTDLYKLTMQCAVLRYFPEAGEFPIALSSLLWTCMNVSLLMLSPGEHTRCYLFFHESNASHEVFEGSLCLVKTSDTQ